MTSGLRKWSCRIIALVILYHLPALVVWPLAECDYSRLRGGQNPRFARETHALRDGGTIVFKGVGYSVSRRHSLHETDGRKIGYIIGPKRTIHVLAFYPWFWSFRTKEATHFEDHTDEKLEHRTGVLEQGAEGDALGRAP